MSSKIILYGVDRSPPVRAVKLTLNALNLDYDYKVLNTEANDHKTPEYLAKNPQHSMPMLEDDGKVIVDSHAIIAYLVRQYGKDDSLYPKDPYAAAIVDHRLHYENGVIFMGLRKNILPLMKGQGTKEGFEEALQEINEIYGVLEAFLGHNEYMAGQNMTIADFSIVTSLSASLEFVSLEKYPKLAAWYQRMQKLPYYKDVNEKGEKELAVMIKDKLQQFK